MRSRLALFPALALLAAPAAAEQAVAVATAGGAGRSSVVLTVPFANAAQFNQRRFQAIAIVEDSRCPPNANCVWAGRLIVDARYGRQPLRLELGKPVAVPGGRLTLIGANGPAAAGSEMPPEGYQLRICFDRP